MKTKIKLVKGAALLLLLSTLNSQLSTASAQGTAFTYQGQLYDTGQPANGTYDLRFSLFTTNSGGSLVYGFVTNSAIAVSNGLFTVAVDFGSNVFNGTVYWLQIGVRTNGAATFVAVLPRQQLTPAPYSIFAENVNAGGISGTIPAGNFGGTYGNAVNFNNGADTFDGSFYGAFYGSSFVGGTFVGDFVGNGSGLTDVWQTGGNSGTTAGVNFVGTTDNQPLELHVNGQRVLRLTPDNSTNDAPDIIGGSPVNTVAPGLVGVTISGGGAAIFNGRSVPNQVLGDFNTIGGGYGNTTGSTNFDVTEATVAGGALNTASGITSTVGGGANNIAYNNNATVAGGLQNRANYHSFVGSGYGDTADGSSAVIGGGYINNIQTNTDYSVIGGGFVNTIQGSGGESGATIAGGAYNTIQPSQIYDGNFYTYSSFSTISGGLLNQVQNNAIYSVIGGGLDNSIQTGSHASVIAGGQYNTIAPNAPGSFISSGTGNAIQAGSFNGAIGGGQSNIIQIAAQDSVIGGGFGNTIVSNAPFSTIAGGDFNGVQTFSTFATIGGGDGNIVQTNNLGSTIAGGYGNLIQISTFAVGVVAASSIGGGDGNLIQTNALYSTIAGGVFNTIGANAATIGGGGYNTNNASFGMIPGGNENYTAGTVSFAAGNHAQALYSGDFVWADSQNAAFPATTSDQVSFRCQGGARFTSGASGAAQTVAWTPGSGSWSFSSDRNLKDRFETVDAASVLDRVSQLPVVEWSYKGYAQRHIGAMAQDFHALFPLNNDDKSLNDADLHGVELSAIQGLNQKLNEKDAEIQNLKQQNETLEKRLDNLAETVKSLTETK